MLRTDELFFLDNTSNKLLWQQRFFVLDCKYIYKYKYFYLLTLFNIE